MLQPLVVQHEALDEELLQPSGGPLPELRPAGPSHAVADGENGGQAVVLDRARHIALTLGSNYSDFPNSCLRRNLRVSVNA